MMSVVFDLDRGGRHPCSVMSAYACCMPLVCTAEGLDDVEEDSRAVATGNATTWSMDPINLLPPFARSCDRLDYMCVGQHHTLSATASHPSFTRSFRSPDEMSAAAQASRACALFLGEDGRLFPVECRLATESCMHPLM
jgi:hypothetical protein